MMRPLRRVRTVEGLTRDRIVEVLRRGARTVDELAGVVGLTPNAVRQHLATLERDGIAVRRGQRRGATVGKPANVYEISAEAESALSRAYAPALTALLAALPDHMATAQLGDLLRDVGARMAKGAPAPQGDLGQRARAAAAVLESLGGVTEIHEGGTTAVILGCSCPLAQAVAVRPELCRALEATLATVTGTRVTERCDRSGAPRCQFEMAPLTAPVATPSADGPA
jgi:predicted ArsR family transcriptional regulator